MLGEQAQVGAVGYALHSRRLAEDCGMCVAESVDDGLGKRGLARFELAFKPFERWRMKLQPEDRPKQRLRGRV